GRKRCQEVGGLHVIPEAGEHIRRAGECVLRSPFPPDQDLPDRQYHGDGDELGPHGCPPPVPASGRGGGGGAGGGGGGGGARGGGRHGEGAPPPHSAGRLPPPRSRRRRALRCGEVAARGRGTRRRHGRVCSRAAGFGRRGG